MTPDRLVDSRRLPPEMGLLDVLRAHTATLRAAGVPSPDVDAQLLAEYTLGRPRHVLAATTVGEVNGEDLRRLSDLVARRAKRTPLQYLVGEAHFRTISVSCRPGVFVPRPETELLAGIAIEEVSRRPSPVVVEPCTGTGVVSLAIASEVAGVRVIATDRSPEAVQLARENLERVAVDPGLAAASRVDIIEGDLMEPVPEELRGHVDVLVCNPPYLAESELAATGPEVRNHDPLDALISGPTGNEVVDRLVREAPAWLAPGGWLQLEVDDARAVSTAERIRGAGYLDVAVVADLTGRDRFVIARHDPTAASTEDPEQGRDRR